MQFHHHQSTNPFIGIRFYLAGFDPLLRQQVKSELVSVGAVDVGQYGNDCNLVIVHNLLFDDPICVTARRDGKTVVRSLWVEDSLEVGAPLDLTPIIYRPPKDLNGIPGAKKLIICLTGYQGSDRQDIMRMVELMGAEFSKPLTANRVTHLICFKFEGEKYDLARKMGNIKLINHVWLEDCLKAWKILPEENYRKSGHELEMEAEVKDSDDETEEASGRPAEGGNINDIPNLQNEIEQPQRKVLFKEEMKSVQALKSTNKNQTEPSSRLHIVQNQMDANPVSLYDKIDQIGKDVPSTSRNAEPLVDIDAEKFGNLSGMLKTPTRQSSLAVDVEDNVGNISGEGCKVLHNSDNRKNSPLDSRRSSRKSTLFMQIAGSLGDSEARLKDNLTENVIKDICNSNLQTGDDKGASASVESPNTELLSHSNKKSPQSSRRTPGRSRLSLQSVGNMSNNSDGKLPSKSSVEVFDVPSADANGPDIIVPQKRKVDGEPNVSHASPKSRKLSTPVSKGIEVADPTTPASSTLVKAKNVSPNTAGHSVNVTCRPSSTEKATSINSKVKSFADKSVPNTSRIATSASPSVHNNNEEQVTEEQKNVYPVPGDLEVDKSMSSKLNADDHTNNVISKPARKKSIARKTLGSRPKIRRASVNAKKGSLAQNSSGGGETLHSAVEIEEKKTSSSIAGRLLNASPVAHVNVGTLDDETEAPPELDLQNENSESNEQLHCHPDKAEISPPSSHETLVQEVPVAETGKKRQPLETHKKGFSGKTKKIGLAANKKHNDSKVGEVGKCSKEVAIEERIACDTGKEDSEQLAGQTIDSSRDDNGTSKGGKLTGKLARKKRRGTLLLNKPESLVEAVKEDELNKENISITDEDKGMNKGGKLSKKLTGKKRCVTSVLNKSEEHNEVTNDNELIIDDAEAKGNYKAREKSGCKSDLTVNKVDENIRGQLDTAKDAPAWFLLSGHRLQRKEYQKLVKSLKGKLCRDSHQWSYQATHLILPDPIRRTEKFFAAAASGSWILKSDYLTASSQAGKFLPEEPYEWHKTGLSDDGAINLEAPRKWRLLKEKTGHCAFYGLRVIIYGECIAPPLDTLKRVVKAGDGTILATSPPYTRFINSGIDFAIVSPGMPRVDMWVQEFLRHEIPCVLADYLVEYVCKPGYPLDKHVQYNTHRWVAKSFSKLTSLAEECVTNVATPENQISSGLACNVCGSSDRGEVMLICGDETDSFGCGIGMHIDCCDPPLKEVPQEDWFCPKCSETSKSRC